MRDLIFLSTEFLRWQDPFLVSDEYEHGHWFRLHNSLLWATHTQSRVTTLDTPWPLAPSMFPIPPIDQNEHRFDVVIETVAEEFGKQARNHDKAIVLFWSGGIDSTAILVSILKTWTQDLLDRLIILCDNRLQYENAYFYHKFIKDKIVVRPLSWLQIDQTNYDKIIILDGEAGNQILNGTGVQRWCYREQFDLLNKPWRNKRNLEKLLINSDPFNIEIIVESINHAPVEIKSGYDFLWWTGFNMKMHDVLLRKMFTYALDLTPEQTKTLWETGVYRFYQHSKLQVWSMNTCNLRREKLPITVKYHAKKYIYDFDNNDFYWSNKTEQASTSPELAKHYPGYVGPWFAIDVDWKRYSFGNPETRYEIGKLLNRI
jgi:hypothetical protein